MKDLGTLNLKGDGTFKVYVTAAGEDVDLSMYNPEILQIATGYVNVVYSGVYAGTEQSLRTYIFGQVLEFLADNDYLERVAPTMLFADCNYIPTNKLLK